VEEKEFSTTQLFGKYKGEYIHLQSKWRIFHMVGGPQGSQSVEGEKADLKQLEKYLRKAYLSEKYFDGKIK